MRRLGWLGLGVVLGLSALLIPRPAQRRCSYDLVPVVVLASDVPGGTEITFDHLAQRSVPESLVAGSMVKADSAGTIVGQRLLVELKAGDLLRWPDFGVDRLSVPKQQRAFAIALDPAQMISGQLARGDHVDVLATMLDAQTNERIVGRVSQNVVVLGTTGAEAIVRVSAEDSERLMLAQDVGRLALALRNPQDEEVDDRAWASLRLLTRGGVCRLSRDQFYTYPAR